MTDEDLAGIEAALGVALPVDYRNLMLTRAEELKAVTWEIAGETCRFFESTLFLEASDVISNNSRVRDRYNDDTARFFPAWWKTFFLVGTNGGGDYYCVCLEGDNHVWMIGSDCGDKPTKQYESLNDFVEQHLQMWRDEMDPPLPPSSFDEALPLVERFQFQSWDDAMHIKALEGDRPLTADKLQQHGIDVDELKRGIQKIFAAFAQRPPGDVRILEVSHPHKDGHLAIPFQPLAMSDPRLLYGNVDAFRGGMFVKFGLTDDAWEKMPLLKRFARLWQHPAIWKSTPSARTLKVNWKGFNEGVIQLLRTLHPGAHVSMTALEPHEASSTDAWWAYYAEYSLDSS